MDPAAPSEKAQRFEKQILVHLNELYRAARRLTEQVSDAEDLVQETCLRAFKSLDQLRHPAAAKVWTFSILRSVYLRQEERRPSRAALVSLEDIVASFLAPSETLQDSYEAFLPPEQALRQEIREAMLKLPLVYREAVILAHVAGFSYREMAQILGLPIGTVMSRLFRGTSNAADLPSRAPESLGDRAMTCQDFVRAIDPYLDGELSVLEILRAHGHLLSCDRCRKMLESEATLHSLLAADATQDEPPPGLRDRLLDRIGRAPSVQSSVQSPQRRSAVARVLLAGLALAAVLLVPVLATRFWRPAEVPPFALEVAAKHRLYTEIPRPALDMTTTDVVGLTEWLGRRVGFPVKAPRLVVSGQQLVGGRVSSVADATAVYLLYEWRGRRLSLFVTAPLPRSRPEGAERIVDGAELYTTTLSGVTLVWWEDSGRLYTAASTGSITDLTEFALLCVRSGRLTSPRPHATQVRHG